MQSHGKGNIISAGLELVKWSFLILCVSNCPNAFSDSCAAPFVGHLDVLSAEAEPSSGLLPAGTLQS
eukprot:12137054-Alexandrium_andersonii.AAC.1